MSIYQSETQYSLHVQLVGIEPAIWRNMLVPGAISLHTLHKMLQVVMGWENSHLYAFTLTAYGKPTTYGLPNPEGEMHFKDSRRTKLDATVWASNLPLTYAYDFGDGWMHQITIEKIEHLPDTLVSQDQLWVTPRCLGGERACPPEDVGGAGGYASFLEAFRDADHPQHHHMREWVGAFYDPECFSVQQANSALAVLE